MDDKNLFVYVHIFEARVLHALRNLPKAKASLTAARSNANSIYISPIVQSSIDSLSGTLHAEERDYKTAFSYFFEAFEALNAMGDEGMCLTCLRYMLLCKVMTDNTADVGALLAGKHGIHYAGPELRLCALLKSARNSLARCPRRRNGEVWGGARGEPLIAAHLRGCRISSWSKPGEDCPALQRDPGNAHC